jgi:uncharacterized protein YbjT (DUF2867 family)
MVRRGTLKTDYGGAAERIDLSTGQLRKAHASLAQFRTETKYASHWSERGCRILTWAEVLFVKQSFAAIILRGTGHVGGAAVAELLATSECREVVMVTRNPVGPRSRVRNVVRGTGAGDFAERAAALAREVLSQGPVRALSCVGVGSGSMRWSEEELQQLELGVVGAFTRGCHNAGIAQFCLLSAAGSTARSRFRYVRGMGMKEDTARNVGFARLAMFRPRIIVGNAHTPAWVGWLGGLVPGSFGNIDQRILGRSIAEEIALHSRQLVKLPAKMQQRKNRCAVRSLALGVLPGA